MAATTNQNGNKTAMSAPFRLFFRPVKADEIDARIQSINKKFATVLLYKDARVDQNILDETVGCYNWQKAYSRDNQNCTVSIWDEQKGQWISKEDTGTESNTEKEKGLASDSFKRACFCWGIGRELYTTPLIQIPTEFFETKVDSYNGRESIKTYDRICVDDLEVTVDEATGIKRIVKLTVSIEHNHYGKKMREWVWSWGGDVEIRTHKPSWVKGGDAPQNQGNNGGNGGWGNSPQNNTPQNNAPAQQGGWGNNAPQNNAPAPQNQGGRQWGGNNQGNAPQNNGGNGGWGSGNSSGGQSQKGSFGHGQGGNTQKRSWGA